jgi:hypothetical protein
MKKGKSTLGVENWQNKPLPPFPPRWYLLCPSVHGRRVVSRRCRHQPTVMDGSAQMSLTEWEGWEGVILWNFNTPCTFSLLWSNRRSITHGHWRKVQLLGLAVDGRVRMLRSFVRRRQKMHGVWKFNNITPSHPSHAVDVFCARPSMAVGWCLHPR